MKNGTVLADGRIAKSDGTDSWHPITQESWTRELARQEVVRKTRVFEVNAATGRREYTGLLKDGIFQPIHFIKPVKFIEPTPPSGPTDVKRTVNTRREQAYFRKMAEFIWQGECSLKGYASYPLDMLEANHPKPRKDMAEAERLACGRAGMLLPKHYHAAYDHHYISFDAETGQVIRSSKAPAGAFRDIRKSARLRKVTPELREYLLVHNAKVGQ